LSAARLAKQVLRAHAQANQNGNPVAMTNPHALRCWFNRHEPDREAVVWDGYHYVGTCRHCTAAIRRRVKKRWERDWIAAKA
jgi:hypothetical protein